MNPYGGPDVKGFDVRFSDLLSRVNDEGLERIALRQVTPGMRRRTRRIVLRFIEIVSLSSSSCNLVQTDTGAMRRVISVLYGKIR